MSTTNNNLDISTISTDDLDQLAQTINSFYSADSAVKTKLAYHWERNQLMLDGQQWLVYDTNGGGGGQWNNLKVSSDNEYIPRPVTNYLFDQYQTLKSYLIKNKPRSKVYPNTQQNKDKVAAKIGSMILEGNWERLKEQFNYETAAACLVTYGTVFKKSYWDTSAVNLVKVPKLVSKPVTDPNTGQVIGESQEPDLDPITGDPLFEELPIGDINTYVLEPYRISLDPLAMHIHEAKWIMEYSIQTLDWIRETYTRDAPGYTGKALEVEEESELNNSLRRWFQLKNSTGVKERIAPGSSNSSGSDVMVENSAVVKEYYERPSSDHPKGRLIVIANNICVYAGPSPYEGPELGDWHPYSECRWEIVPGRFWGKSPLDSGVELQKRINSIDAIITLTRKTSAIPQKLIPMSSGVAPGTWTGRPNQEVYYRTDGGSKPETIPASGVDPSVFAERAQCVSDLQQIMGGIDILKGDRPPGVNAASALNLLYEVGTGKLYPILDRWKVLVESDQKKQLRLIGTKYKEPRPDFIRMLQSKNKDLSETEINQFIGSDLCDNFNVVVEAGSNIPKLQAAKQSMLMEQAQMGMLNLQDPGNRVQFQKDMGIQGYDADIEPDIRRAEWENDLLDDLDKHPDMKPVVLAFDNHQVHKQIHENRMKSPTFMSLSFELQQAYMQHDAEHDQFIAQAKQAQMLEQQAMAPGSDVPPAPEGGSQPAGADGGHGKGLHKDQKNAIIGGTDTMNPATLGTNR